MLDRTKIQVLRDAGCEVWWYGEGVSFFEEPWQMRRKGWQTFAWGLDGDLLYRTDLWTRFWDNRLSGKLPFTEWRETGSAGAAYVYYRSVHDAATRMPSLRLWNYRDGIEDFEYLHILRRRVERLKKQKPHAADLLAEAPRALAIRGFVIDPMPRRFASSSNQMLLQRQRVAELIEKLGRELAR